MKASKCFRAKAQYYANITLKWVHFYSIARLIELLCRLNVKLGGINAIPEVNDVSFLTDSANPTIVMGRYRYGLMQSNNYSFVPFDQVPVSVILPLVRDARPLPRLLEALTVAAFDMFQRWRCKHLVRKL